MSNASTRRCRFCGAAADSREHVLPEWLREVLPEQGRIWTVTQEHALDGEPVETRTFPAKPFTQRVRHVCVACNTGWMSQLEGEAKPALTPMIQGRGKELHLGGQRLLAIWAFKTAAMFDLMGIKGGAFPSEHLKWLYKHRGRPNPLPPYLHVWLAACEQGDAVPLYKHHGLRMEASEIELAPGERNGYSATLTVGHLALQIFGTTIPDGVLVKDAGKLASSTAIRVWPTADETVIWPPSKVLSVKGIDAWADALLSGPRR